MKKTLIVWLVALVTLSLFGTISTVYGEDTYVLRLDETGEIKVEKLLEGKEFHVLYIVEVTERAAKHPAKKLYQAFRSKEPVVISDQDSYEKSAWLKRIPKNEKVTAFFRNGIVDVFPEVRIGSSEADTTKALFLLAFVLAVLSSLNMFCYGYVMISNMLNMSVFITTYFSIFELTVPVITPSSLLALLISIVSAGVFILSMRPFNEVGFTEYLVKTYHCFSFFYCCLVLNIIFST
jgi:hypothetical protein